MIRLKGELTITSADSTIKIFRDGDQLTCHITGWPKPLNPSLSFKRFLSNNFDIEPVLVKYNAERLGVLKNGKIRNINWIVGLKAFFEYLKTKIL